MTGTKKILVGLLVLAMILAIAMAQFENVDERRLGDQHGLGRDRGYRGSRGRGDDRRFHDGRDRDHRFGRDRGSGRNRGREHGKGGGRDFGRF